MTRAAKALQFKVTLLSISPEIWRRIQVPQSYSFWDLHVAIQDAMGWQDQHLHIYRLPAPHPGNFTEVGIPDGEVWEAEEVLPGWQFQINQYFKIPGARAYYDYDFGDNWEHEILFEEILPREKGVRYPRCLAGGRACPPESCGGPAGYADLLTALKSPNSEARKRMPEWAGGPFNPERFDPGKVRFDNPKKRLRMSIGEV